MFISPIDAINNGWITHPLCSTLQDWQDRKFVSPNAIDFTVDTLSLIDCQHKFLISERHKIMRPITQLPLRAEIDNESESGLFWHLESNMSYDVMSHMYVTVPEGVAAYLVTRSTFVRNGLFIQAGLFDQGYQGAVGCVLHNTHGTSVVGLGTRIGQIIFVESNGANMYAGGYNTKPGEHWTTSIQ